MRYNFYECGIASSSALFRSCLESVWGHFSIDRVDFGRLDDYSAPRVARSASHRLISLPSNKKHVCKYSAFRSG